MSTTKDKWRGVQYREMRVREKFDWMRCQCVRTGGRGVELLGFGRTMFEANRMAEKKVGR